MIRPAAADAGTGVDGLTLGAFLALGGYSDYFVRHFMVPVVSCVWSSGTGLSLQYPAEYLFRFLANHGMLSVSGSPQWRTVTGGSRAYVEKAAKGLTAVQTGAGVRSLTRHPDGVQLVDGDGERHEADVVVAMHPDHAKSVAGLLDVLRQQVADVLAVQAAWAAVTRAGRALRLGSARLSGPSSRRGHSRAGTTARRSPATPTRPRSSR